MAQYTSEELNDLTREQLLDLPVATKISGRHDLRKEQLVDAILEEQSSEDHPANVGGPGKPKVDLSNADLQAMTKDELRDVADQAGIDTTQRMTHDDLVTALSSSTAAQTVTPAEEQLNPPRRSAHDGREDDPALRSGLAALPFKRPEAKDHAAGSGIGRGSAFDVGQYEDGGGASEDDDESAS